MPARKRNRSGKSKENKYKHPRRMPAPPAGSADARALGEVARPAVVSRHFLSVVVARGRDDARAVDSEDQLQENQFLSFIVKRPLMTSVYVCSTYRSRAYIYRSRTHNGLDCSIELNFSLICCTVVVYVGLQCIVTCVQLVG